MSRRVKRDPGRLTGKSAPEPLETIRAFVNTKYGRRHDEIVAADQLRTWLVRRRLLAGGAAVTEGDVRRALEAREAIRGLLRANNGVPPDTGVVRALNNVSGNAPVVARFDERGQAHLEPDITGVDGALARILGIVVVSMAEGTWARLKACRNNPCQFAFFDRSKNRSAVWCDMSVCGNRINARVYRQRRRKRHRTKP